MAKITHCLTCTKEIKTKLSAWKNGEGKYCSRECKWKSPLWKIKIAKKATGKKHTQETKEKIRQVMLGQDRGGFERKCKTCKKPFKCNPSDKTINCSKKCSAEYFSKFCGPRSHSWKGGLTPKYRRDRACLKYRKWRKSVLERDNYTCRLCGKRGGKLEADHIKQFALYPKLRFEVSNGRTLCKPCHKTTDTYLKKNKI